MFLHLEGNRTVGKMRLNVAIFFGALFGALGVLLFLVAFGSDYWLLATEVGRCSGEQNVRFSFKIRSIDVFGRNEGSLMHPLDEWQGGVYSLQESSTGS